VLVRRGLGDIRKTAASPAPKPAGHAWATSAKAATRRAGMEVELFLPADCAQVPPGVGMCAYRIVQEALSNAGRHAPVARAP
jgi:signal transduction histidine kinase